MCAHVFGRVSSASCTIYALRRMPVDNESGKEAGDVVLNNFYVDDY